MLIRTNYLVTARFSVAAQASETTLRFDDPEATNTRSRTAGATMNWGIAGHTSIFTRYSATRFWFEAPDGDSAISTQSLSVGVSQVLPREFTMDVSGGVATTESANSRYQWIGNVVLRKTIRSVATMVSYSRAVSHTSGLTDQLSLIQRYSGEITYNMGPSSSIGLLGTYSMGGTDDSADPLTAVDSRSYSMALNGSWRPRSWLSVNAGYSLHRQRIDREDDTVPWEELRRDRLYLSLNASFDEWKF